MIEDVVKFIMENTTYTDANKMREVVMLHQLYGTSVTVRNELNQVLGYCRWNVLEDNQTAELLDLVVHKDYRGRGMMKLIADLGFPHWSHIKYLQFERGYDDGKQIKKKRKYLISKLWRRIGNANNHFAWRISSPANACTAV